MKFLNISLCLLMYMVKIVKLLKKRWTKLIKAVEKKEKPSKIKTALSVLKDITLRVSSSLIATGILGLLKQLNL